MRMQAPTKKHGQGKVHEVIAGITKCGLMPFPDWETVEKEVTCSHCNGTAGGWKSAKNRRLRHYGMVGYYR